MMSMTCFVRTDSWLQSAVPCELEKAVGRIRPLAFPGFANKKSRAQTWKDSC
jgi:hypothetical protein